MNKNRNSLDLFIKLYKKTELSNRLLNKIRIPSISRVIIRIMANTWVPIIFTLLKKNQYKLDENNKKNEKVIVSFTSFPARIKKVWIVVECLLRQTIKPDKIILYLSKKQFSTLDVLPKKLLKLQQRGLEIILVEEDIKPHKKYYYALKQYPLDYIITVDDDNFYESDFVEKLLYYSRVHINCIICNRASKITYTGDCVSKYNKWKRASSFSIDNGNFFIGCGGVLYPPESLHPKVLDIKTFSTLCPLTDDIWLNLMARLNSTPIFVTDNSIVLPIYNKNPQNLYSHNIGESNNDISIRNLKEYFYTKYNIDIFSKLNYSEQKE